MRAEALLGRLLAHPGPALRRIDHLAGHALSTSLTIALRLSTALYPASSSCILLIATFMRSSRLRV